MELLAGVDEAGRGPIAGPVVAASVILPYPCDLKGVDDSKKIKSKKREELFEKIQAKAIAIGIGIIESSFIDKCNILQATFEAMRQAIVNMKIVPKVVLVDGNMTIPGLKLFQIPAIKGDGFISSIAAASIIAKVTRDKIMEIYDKKYPEYGFGVHKGYATSSHVNALISIGPSPIHRLSFAPVTKVLLQKR